MRNNTFNKYSGNYGPRVGGPNKRGLSLDRSRARQSQVGRGRLYIVSIRGHMMRLYIVNIRGHMGEGTARVQGWSGLRVRQISQVSTLLYSTLLCTVYTYSVLCTVLCTVSTVHCGVTPEHLNANSTTHFSFKIIF